MRCATLQLQTVQGSTLLQVLLGCVGWLSAQVIVNLGGDPSGYLVPA